MSPCRRRSGRQGDGQRVAAKHHEGDQPPNCPLAVRVAAEKLGDVPDRRGLRLDLPALGAQGGAVGFEVGQGRPLPLTLTGEPGAGSALVIGQLHGGSGAALLGCLLNGRINLAQPPVKIGDGVGCHLNPGGKRRVLRLNRRRDRAALPEPDAGILVISHRARRNRLFLAGAVLGIFDLFRLLPARGETGCPFEAIPRELPHGLCRRRHLELA